jgi:V/A-type H+-transporting ATPase subunit E
MSGRALVESLRRAADEKVRVLWEEAEAEKSRLRSAFEERIRRMRADNSLVLAARAEDLLSEALSEAKRRERLLRFTAEKALSDRLYSLASSALKGLRDDQYTSLFEKLALELPPLDWRTVRVNPADVGLAKKRFPGAEIMPDERVAGGMDVAAESGAIRAINTLGKRLERSWPEMLPVLIKDVYQEVSRGTSDSS